MGHYLKHKKWRLANPKIRNEGKKRHYAARRFGNRRPWGPFEEEMLLKYEELPDVELAAIMKRSVQALQVKRSRLKSLRGDCGDL